MYTNRRLADSRILDALVIHPPWTRREGRCRSWRPIYASLRIFAAVLSAALLLGSATVRAQEAPNASEPVAAGILKEVVVTAQKRSENLQKVPITVAAISSDALAKAGVTDLLQLSSLVPGLSMTATSSQFAPTLRGIGSAQAGAQAESPVATYIDGVYHSVVFDSDWADIDHVDVLYGPQGTLFGRNASGGVIQIFTEDPEQQFSGHLTSSLDNFLRTSTNVYVSGGITDDLDANLSALYINQSNGWGDNLANGDQLNSIQDEPSLRAKLFYTPDDRTYVHMVASYDSMKGDLSASFHPIPGLTLEYPGPPNTTDNPWNDYLQPTPTLSIAEASLSATAYHEFDFASLKSISAYNKEQRTSLSPVTPLDFDVGFTEHSAEFSQELDLISPNSDKFNWTTGLYYFWSRGSFNPFYVNIDGIQAAPFDALNLYTTAYGDTYSVAEFAQATFLVLPETHLTGGVRYTTERRTMDASESETCEGALCAAVVGPNPVTTLPYTVKDASYDKFTYRIALDHAFSDNIDGYVSYNTGFKSGGFNLSSPSNPVYLPETVGTAEVGLKNTLFDRRARLDVSAFYSSYSNMQLTEYNKIVGAITSNAAASKIYGLDINGVGQVTSAFRLSGSAELLKAYFSDYPNGQVSAPCPSADPTILTIDPTCATRGGAVVYEGSNTGKTLRNSPKLTATVAADYTIPLASDAGTIDLNLSDYYSSYYFGAADDAEAVRQPAYDYLNAAATWTSNDGRYTVMLSGKNLLDKLVYSVFVEETAGYLADTDSPPRTYGLTVSVKF